MINETKQSKPHVSIRLETAGRIQETSEVIGTGVSLSLEPEDHVYSMSLHLPEIYRQMDQLNKFDWIQNSFICFVNNDRNARAFEQEQKAIAAGQEPSKELRAIADFMPSAESGQPSMYDALNFLIFVKERDHCESVEEMEGFKACLDIPKNQIVETQDDSRIFVVGNKALEELFSCVGIAGIDDKEIEQKIRTAWAFYLDKLHSKNKENALLYNADELAEKKFKDFVEENKGGAFLEIDSYEYSKGPTYYFEGDVALLEELESLNLVDPNDLDFIHAKRGNVSEYTSRGERIYPELIT